MALVDEDTVLGVTARPRSKTVAKPQAATIARRAPPKVKGIKEFVGTQLPTEKQKPVGNAASQGYKPISMKEYYDQATAGVDPESVIYSKVETDYNKYVADFNTGTAKYDASVGTYNKAIGVDPNPAKTNAAIRKRLGINQTQTVLSR